MGRKSSTKGKEKRLKRKEEQQRILLAMTVVDKANKLTDPLEPFPVFRKYDKNGLEAELYMKRATDLEELTKSWIFSLTKRNMQIKYEQCSWGWNDAKKMEELFDEAAWYLVAQSADKTLLGFSHFRFDIDEGLEVLYCYELQLEPAVQRKGLGKFMMQILELVAFKNNMKKVVLTILKNNHYSKFFRALNYVVDESSPVDHHEETLPYEILSKVNIRLQTPVTNNADNRKLNSHNGHCCSSHHFHHVSS
ncbi:N-alpha-acetyltransferase 40 [Zophobas morio]|uniref:N-alpha-acetyltransferase 40 n=1 Tax=Zophobas morio TaxID=2755281 RepID=UPI003083BE5B